MGDLLELNNYDKATNERRRRWGLRIKWSKYKHQILQHLRWKMLRKRRREGYMEISLEIQIQRGGEGTFVGHRFVFGEKVFLISVRNKNLYPVTVLNGQVGVEEQYYI